MKRLVLIVILAFIPVATLYGCGDGGGGGVSSLTITGKSGSKVALSGKWSEGCIADAINGESDKEVNTISGASFSFTGNFWVSSTTCSGSPVMTMNAIGTFSLGEEVTATLTASPVTATRIDIDVTSALITVSDADAIADLNTEGFCGAADWVVDTAKEVVGTDCMAASMKDIVYIDDTVDPDLIYYGIPEDEGGMLDADGYPTELDADATEARL